MSLASIIRLEFAYPGVGILAGDSLQYLSIATAHGVIMVFFMIMPVVFGAFGNFLLPTQLGVHDVAFPRLNSAAFWFLPGGLIMLMQLVCVDRRYQRMNCFNIRELQGVLKRKFFTDLINTNDHRDFLNQSIIGLRFKTNNQLSISPDLESFFNFGTTNSVKSKSTGFSNTYSNIYNSGLANLPVNFVPELKNLSTLLESYLRSFITVLSSLNFQTIITLNYLPSIFSTLLTTNLTFNTTYFFSIKPRVENLSNIGTDVNFVSENTNSATLTEYQNSSFSESSNSVRFTKFNNPLISYDYKCGHYLGI
jgi:hypothetical protein